MNIWRQMLEEQLSYKSCQELDQNPPRVVAYGVATEKAYGH